MAAQTQTDASLALLENVHRWSADELSDLKRLMLESLGPPPNIDNNRVAEKDGAAILGHKLFFDKRLSLNGQVACASCHQPERYFTDGLSTAQGIATVLRNTPTIVGIRHSQWFFLDGRTDSLWSQAMGPLENEREHGGNRAQYAHRVYADTKLRRDYEKLFGVMPALHDTSRFPQQAGPVADETARQNWQKMGTEERNAITEVFVNLTKSIAAYELLLNPSPAKFDRYVKAALAKDEHDMREIFTAEEAQGLRLFISKAMCTLCHNGPLFSDFGFHNVATPPRSLKAYDWGRYKGVDAVLKSEFNCRGVYNDSKEKSCEELDYIVSDKDHTLGSFKAPSLRNVSKTAPYMHAGQYQTLNQVIHHYNNPPSTKVGKSDLMDIDLNPSERTQLEAFLHTLDSEIAAEPKWLREPSLE